MTTIIRSLVQAARTRRVDLKNLIEIEEKNLDSLSEEELEKSSIEVREVADEIKLLDEWLQENDDYQANKLNKKKIK